VDETARIELTVRMWSTGAPEVFEEYLEQLIALLPRNHGALERRAAEVDAGPGRADAVLVMSFPDSASVDGFLRDPLRADLEDLALLAVSRSLITDSRHRGEPDGQRDADVVPFRRDGDMPDSPE
jgi:hypothetical protein